MIIKNQELLHQRADAHYWADHIAQKTYGDIRFLQNGESEEIKWQGCAISCLATETTIEALKNQDDLDFEAVEIEEHEDGRIEFEVRLDDDDLRTMLNNKFGMCYQLIYIAEAVFEGSEESYAKKWPVKFAAALADGLNIDDSDIANFWQEYRVSLNLDYDNEDSFPVEFEPSGNYCNDWGYWDFEDYFDVCDEELGDALIDYIGRLAKFQNVGNTEVVAV